MYSKELEELIEAALADGVLTEKKKQVLFKKAKTQGIDLDEFEMVLDARVIKAQQTSHPAKEKLGNIVICPACGAYVPGGSAVCPECGYVFNNVEAISSVKKLNDKIEEIRKKFSDKEVKGLGDLLMNDPQMKRNLEMAMAVASFPIPNSRGDLLEFLPYLKASSETRNIDNIPFKRACRTKYKECVMKAKTSFRDDPAFAPYLQGESILDKIKRFKTL